GRVPRRRRERGAGGSRRGAARALRGADRAGRRRAGLAAGRGRRGLRDGQSWNESHRAGTAGLVQGALRELPRAALRAHRRRLRVDRNDRERQGAEDQAARARAAGAEARMKLRGADVVARTLAAAGVRNVFALSGNHVMPVFDAALDAKLNLIHVRHEAAAVHMADAWGRLTGEPGIALVTGGPGHANALGALYTALAAQSPMVLISGHAPLDELGKGAFQEMPQAALARP